MSNSDKTLEIEEAETLEQNNFAKLETKLDLLLSKVDRNSQILNAHNAQFEAIRRGIVDNSAAFDRMEAKILLLRADVKDLTEEVHQMRIKESLVLEK